MRAPPPPPIILTAVSAFQRRASAHFLRRPRTGKIATSVITRLYAEKAAQRNGSVRLCEAQLWGAMCAFAKRSSASKKPEFRLFRSVGGVGVAESLARGGAGPVVLAHT
jgi:hypothetical protein